MSIYFPYRDILKNKKTNQNKNSPPPKKRHQLVYCIDVLPGNLIVVAVSKTPAA